MKLGSSDRHLVSAEELNQKDGNNVIHALPRQATRGNHSHVSASPHLMLRVASMRTEHVSLSSGSGFVAAAFWLSPLIKTKTLRTVALCTAGIHA